MKVTIDLDERTRLHLTPTRATIVQHADGVPYKVEDYPLSDFTAYLRTIAPRAAAKGEG